METEKKREEKKMTDAELRTAEKKYDDVNNEGADGYNPYRAEREEREHVGPSDGERVYRLRRLLISTPESAPQCEQYRAEIAEIEARMERDRIAQLRAEWTAEVTRARREAWNGWVRGLNGRQVDGVEIVRAEKRLGFRRAELMEAIAMHRADGIIF